MGTGINIWGKKRRKRTPLFYGLGIDCDVFLENGQKRETVPSWNMVVIVFRGEEDLPWTHPISVVTVPTMICA